MTRAVAVAVVVAVAAASSAGCTQEREAPPTAPAAAPPADVCASLPQRIRVANDMLHGPVPSADGAMAIYAEVLAAHERGCALAAPDEWSAREGTGIARMMKGNWPAAKLALEDAARRWPRSATTRYNLACALCRLGDLEGCHQELAAALASAGPAGAQEFVADRERTRADFAAQARQDPDLALLRADPRFERLLAP